MDVTTIAGILRGLGESPPSDLGSTEPKRHQPIEIADDPPVSIAPWIDMAKISAACSRDVMKRAENYSLDDRTFEQKSAQSSRALAAARVTGRIKFKAKAAIAPKPKRTIVRTEALKLYYREYGRAWRAKKKTESEGRALESPAPSAGA